MGLIMKIAIIPNTSKEGSIPFTKEIVKWLLEHNATPILEQDIAVLTGFNEFALNRDKVYEDCDILLVLGGDGTVLKAAQNASRNKKPLLGVNLGNLGYLTDVEQPLAFEALSKVLSGQYKLEHRMMLEGSLTRKDKNNKAYKFKAIALNEIYVSRSNISKMLSLSLKINGEYIDTYRCDGIIVSTPTGSTAYNLSAGGAILSPSSQMIAITHICPHMLHARPFVVGAKDIIEIKILESDAFVMFDGYFVGHLNNEKAITIKRSSCRTTTIKTTSRGFYDILRAKMVVNQTGRR